MSLVITTHPKLTISEFRCPECVQFWRCHCCVCVCVCARARARARTCTHV